LISLQGTKGLTRREAKLIAGEDPNFLSRDLHEAIKTGNYPKWRLCVQIMPEAEGYRNPHAFDATKTWKHKDYPLIEVGIVELNRNPTDYFCETEQVAFSPATIVPGIGFSPDKLLQGRLFIYDDTQHHRVGANYKQLFINRPRVETHTMYVGGEMNIEVKNKFPHYWPSSFNSPQPDIQSKEPPLKCDGAVDYYDYPEEGTDRDYYSQPREFVKLLNPTDRQHLIENIAASFERVVEDVVRKNLLHFTKIDADFGRQIESMWSARKTGTFQKTEGELVLDQISKSVLATKSSA